MTAHPTVHALAGWRTPVLLALSLLATGLQAQTTAPAPQRHSPLQADAPVPPLRHTSPFARYKAHTEVEVGGVNAGDVVVASPLPEMKPGVAAVVAQAD